MDMGVGSFVFSLGVVSTRSFASTPGQSRLRKLGKSLYKATPLVLLGLVRVIMVKGVESVKRNDTNVQFKGRARREATEVTTHPCLSIEYDVDADTTMFTIQLGLSSQKR